MSLGVICKGEQGSLRIVARTKAGLEWIYEVSFIQEHLELHCHCSFIYLIQEQEIQNWAVVGKNNRTQRWLLQEWMD